jgi:hypothetical protein
MTAFNDSSAFAELIEQLDQIRHDDDLVGDGYVGALTAALLSTPDLVPLDDYSFEMLLELSGLCLDDANDVSFAAAVTHFVIGTSHFELVCSHDEPSPLCARVRSDVDAQVQQQGAELALSGRLDGVLKLRARRGSKEPPTTL